MINELYTYLSIISIYTCVCMIRQNKYVYLSVNTTQIAAARQFSDVFFCAIVFDTWKMYREKKMYEQLQKNRAPCLKKKKYAIVYACGSVKARVKLWLEKKQKKIDKSTEAGENERGEKKITQSGRNGIVVEQRNCLGRRIDVVHPGAVVVPGEPVGNGDIGQDGFQVLETAVIV